MDIRLLQTFVTAARLGNLTQAANRLFLAQPTVTVQIGRLEQHLGYTLFKRSHSGVTLTPAGRRFLPHAQRILEDYEAGIGDLASWSQGYHRRLTVIASPQVAATDLPPLLSQFTSLHREVELSVEVRQSADVGPALAAGLGDLGLSLLPSSDPILHTEVLYTVPVMLVAPGRSVTGGGEAEPSDWRAVLERHLLFTHSHPVYWDDLLLALRQEGARVRTARVSESYITRRLVEEGLGVSFLPEPVVRQAVREGSLRPVPTPGLELPSSYTYLVLPRGEEPAPAAAAFLGLLRHHFGGAG